MKIGKRAAIALIGMLLPVAPQAKEDFHHTVQKDLVDHMEEGPEKSPFRDAVMPKVKARRGQGKPAATLDYHEAVIEKNENGKGWGKGDCEEKGRCPVDGYVVRYSVKTDVRYPGPGAVFDDEHGKPARKWPELKLRKHVQDANGNWVPAEPAEYEDYTQKYKEAVEAYAASKGKVAWGDEAQPDGPYVFGEEPLEEEIVEEITFTFKKDQQEQGKAFFRRLSAALAAGDVGAEAAILMGFTYSGPNIDYTVGGKKKVCLFGGCVEIYDIRAGFALDWALGLRLPARSRLEGPGRMVAGQNYTFSSFVDATGTYPDGSLVGDWSPARYTAAGAAPEAGNEFAMRIEMFAGAKVRILGADVCPYCQYVEIDQDYGKTFPTPYGGNPPFPLPVMDIPIKSWNYGIVSLGVGLTVTPELGSDTISAWTNGGLKLDHAGGQATTFGVKACFAQEPNAPHAQAVELSQYQYWFDSFKLKLGAYLNLDVGGYGAWSPSFTFLTLDLSGMLDAAGLYLGDHVQCDFAFNCTAAPVNQGVKLTPTLADEAAPSTSLQLVGTEGKRGWWTTDVTGQLTARDNPVDCGVGVASTYWGLDGGQLQNASTFTLTSERKMAVAYGSSDDDGNAEPLHPVAVWIDKTPPTITGAATTLPNARGWYNSNVVVHFVPGDATSGVYASTPDTTLSAEARDQWVEGTVEDFAGWTHSVVVGGINIDKTAPDIQITLPDADDQYEADGVYTFAWTITDGLSGELSRASTLDGSLTAPVVDPNRTPIVSGASLDFGYLSGGVHELLVTATDNADNVATSTVRFVVDVDIDGLIHATDLMCTGGFLSRGACKSLMVKAQQAKRALDAGQTNAARGVLLGYKQELVALRGKGVKEDAFVLLYADVQYVLRRYGLIGTT